MLSGDFTAGDVTVFASRVMVNGVARPAVKVELTGGWRSDLPSQISSAGSNMVRDGTVQWATEQDVSQRPVTAFRAWGVWRPQKGDRIVVYAGDGTSEWPRFTGVVDETTGSVGSGMSSTIIADVDPLSESFQSEPLLARMYPRSGSTAWRNAGLTPMYFVDAAMRAGGYYTTTPTAGQAALHVPLQGSMLPAVGTSADLLSGDGHTTGGYQDNWGAPWGLSAGNFVAEYAPAFSRKPSESVALQMMFTASHAATAYVTVHYGSANYFRLIINSSGNAVFQRMRGTDLVEVCRINNVVGDATRVEVLVKDGAATLRANNGKQASGTVSDLQSNNMSKIGITAPPDARIAGVQVSHPEPWQEWQYLNFRPTARIRTHTGNATTWGTINASPRYARRTALSMLEELADQTLSAMWIDEEGVLQFAPSNGVRNTASVQTITTADDVLALSWSDRLLAVAKRVTVEYLHPAFNSGTSRSVFLAQGSRTTLRQGDVVEDVYSPGSDQDWYGVDASPYRLPGDGWSPYNDGIGSFVGLTYYEGEDVVTGSIPYSSNISMSRTGLSEWTVTHEAVSYGAGVTAETLTHPDASALWKRNRGESLPILRGWAKIRWDPRETTTSVASPGPVLRHDLGAMSTSDNAQNVRDYLHALILEALPQITGLEVTPDPRRQIGDTITLSSQGFLGVTIRGKVTGIQESLSADGYTQSFDMEPAHVTTGALTWAEWEQAFPGTLTYTQWEALRAPTETYTDFENDPLKGADEA